MSKHSFEEVERNEVSSKFTPRTMGTDTNFFLVGGAGGSDAKKIEGMGNMGNP
jgi:hypothetical protein